MRRPRLAQCSVVAIACLAGCTAGRPPPTGTASASVLRSPQSGSRVTTSPSRTPGPAWVRLPDAPSDRSEVTAAAAGGRIFVIGGFDQNRDTQRTVEVYDIGTRTWSRGPDLPIGVNHPMAAELGGAVYVFGGYLGPS